MKLPRYWVKEEGEATTPAGKVLRVAAWQWSQASGAEARDKALGALARMRERIQTGLPFPERYAYGSRPAREETIREVRGRGGDVEAAITRNAYGALVLNASRAMFVDADRPASGAGLLARWFGRKPDKDPAVERAEALVAAEPSLHVRVYRTRAGFRYLVTHDLFDPVSASARELMQRLGADPKYVQLCAVQESFRARLTPKPWRIGLGAPPVRWPWADTQAETAMREWLSRYDRARAGKAVCALVTAVGSGRTHPALEDVVRLHDAECGVGTGAPLA
jgi:hypothetical protein